jgi:hypothetical protein
MSNMVYSVFMCIFNVRKAFLFLLVAEGLGGLMKKAVETNRFRGFQVGSGGFSVSHLQYADDTLCVGEASITNLWTLQAILRGF